MSNLAGVAREPASERAHLELTHHELCTALTSARSNVELVRIALRGTTGSPKEERIVEHLVELEVAIERLERLAVAVRAWHAAGES